MYNVGSNCWPGLLPFGCEGYKPKWPEEENWKVENGLKWKGKMDIIVIVMAARVDGNIQREVCMTTQERVLGKLISKSFQALKTLT